MPAIATECQRPAQAPTVAPTLIADFQKETILIEMLLSSLDLRANAALAGSPMLTYLVDLLVMRAREELHAVSSSDAASWREPGRTDGTA